MTEQAEHKTTVLVVDDDRLLRRQLHWALVERHRVLEAETRADAVQLLQRERVDVVICDLHLPPDLDGNSGFDDEGSMEMAEELAKLGLL